MVKVGELCRLRYSRNSEVVWRDRFTVTDWITLSCDDYILVLKEDVYQFVYVLTRGGVGYIMAEKLIKS
jgi:hypothetical protein